MVKQDSNSRRRTFTAGFKPAHLFLRSLTLMEQMASSAALIVKIDEIQVLVTSKDRKAIASLVMEGLTAFSWNTDFCAFQFDLSSWIHLLRSPVTLHENAPLWIYQIRDSPDLYCVVGDDSAPINLGKASFVRDRGIDVENLVSHPVTVQLKSDCLREIISTCSSRFDHVLMLAFEDSAAFLTASGLLRYHSEIGDCVIECVGPRTARYVLVEWRGAQILHRASELSEEVLICSMLEPEWMEWIMFSFLINESSFFSYMMQGSDAHIVPM